MQAGLAVALALVLLLLSAIATEPDPIGRSLLLLVGAGLLFVLFTGRFTEGAQIDDVFLIRDHNFPANRRHSAPSLRYTA